MRYRKKPVEIEAMQWDGSIPSAQAILRWAGDAVGFRSEQHGHPEESKRSRKDWLIIRTIEGVMNAQPNDWIIKGVKGEFYPCKPDIFVATYEPAATQSAPR